MPVTKSAKRAERGSARKALVNKKILDRLDRAIRTAKKKKSDKEVRVAISLTDRAAKKKVIHKNKAARIKSSLAKLISTKKSSSGGSKKPSPTKTKRAKSKKR